MRSRTGDGERVLRRSRFGAGCLAAVLGLIGSQLGADPAAAQVEIHREIECLALTMYFEARGEPDVGKLAVGHVVMNRAQHPAFPKAVCDVVRQGGEKLRYRCQFTWWCDGRSDQPVDWRAWERSKALARRVFWNYSKDPTGGALWYHAENARPIWRRDLAQGPKIGRHIFYRSTDGLQSKAQGGGSGPPIPVSYAPK